MFCGDCKKDLALMSLSCSSADNIIYLVNVLVVKLHNIFLLTYEGINICCGIMTVRERERGKSAYFGIFYIEDIAYSQRFVSLSNVVPSYYVLLKAFVDVGLYERR